MKFRLAAAVAVTGALFLSMSGAQAATPVMDGKKVKVLTLSTNAVLQDNDRDGVTGLAIANDTYACTLPRCAKLPFVYKPAKGVKGGLLFTMTWKNAAVSDMDLYVYSLDKRGNATKADSCGGTGTASEKIYMDSSSLKSGTTYVMIMDFFRSMGEVVTGKIQMGVPSTIPTTVPAKADGAVYKFNCTL